MIISIGAWNFIFIVGSFFFVGPDNSYSVLLPEGTQLVQVDTLDNGMVNHTFIGIDKGNNFEYSLSLSVVEGESQKLIDSETVKSYEGECNCEVVSVDEVEFRNFTGVKYSIRKEVESTELGGEVYISKLRNGKSINVVSMVLYNQREHVSENLSPILNTLILNF